MDGDKCLICRDLYQDRYRFYAPINNTCPRFKEIADKFEMACDGDVCHLKN